MSTATSTPVKANQWLLDNGFIKQITRGRRSAENNIRLHEAHLSGVRFTDWQPSEGTDSKGDYATTNATPTAATTKVIADVTYTYPEKDWQAYAMVGGKRIEVGMRECCSSCYDQFKIHVSLTGHVCATPAVTTIIADGMARAPKPVRVTLEPRTTPLPAKRW